MCFESLTAEKPTAGASMRHPHHDTIAASIRAAYAGPQPDMGWAAKQRRFGIYRQNTKAATHPDVIVRDLAPGDVEEFLKDVRGYFGVGPRSAKIMIDDRRLDSTLGPVLEATGLPLDERTSFLAHVGDVPDPPPVAGIAVETVGEGGLEEYEDTRCRGFANSDEPTSQKELDWRTDLRRAELTGGANYWLARVGEEPAAAMSWYDREDRLVFSLATRLPFRRRGIASHLLCRLLRDSERKDTRSVIINANEAGRPIELYRRLRFTDEIYWHATYELTLGA
jgi:GNAT superfamily N-acetyltransferase